MTATFVKQLRGGNWGGDARLYRLDPPMDGVEHVIVSAVHVLGLPETYIFSARADGSDVVSWTELNGSFKGDLDHARALRNAGYDVL